MHILIIGAVRPGHQKALDMGHQVTLFINKDNVRPGDATFPYRQVFVMNPDASPKEYVSLAEVIHQHSPIDAVCCFNDIAQENAVAVTEKLNLPFPVNAQTLSCLYNKKDTRALLHSSLLDDTRFKEVTSLDDIVAFSHEIGGPVIIKPQDSTGSSGIVNIKNAGEVELSMRRFFDNGHKFPAIAEEFLVGKEYSVEAFSEGGKHIILGITEKLKDENTFIELGHVFPASLSDENQNEVESFVSKILTNVGLTDGPSHTEIILTSNGPRIIESHSRAGGDKIFDLIDLATGVDVLKMSIRQALGENVLDDIVNTLSNNSGKSAAIRFLSLGFDKNTKLISIDNLDKARLIEGVIDISPMKESDAVMDVVKDSFARTLWAVATGDTPEIALQQAEKSIREVKINLQWEMR